MNKAEKQGWEKLRASVTCRRTTLKQSNMHIIGIPDLEGWGIWKEKMAEIFLELIKHSIHRSKNLNESQAGWNKENHTKPRHKKFLKTIK